MFTMFDVAGLAALTLATLPATAATAANTWDGGGGDDSWSTAANWDDDTVPTFPAALAFGGAARLTPSNDLSGVTVNGLTFAAGAGAFSLRGNPITLGGDITVTDGGSVTNNQVVDLPITLGADANLYASSSKTTGGIILNREISGPYKLKTLGTFYTQLNATNTYTGGTQIYSSLGPNYYVSIGNDCAFGTGTVKFGPDAWTGSGQAWVPASGGDRTITNDTDLTTALFISSSANVAGKAPGLLTLSGNILVHQRTGFYVQMAGGLTLTGPVSGGGTAGRFYTSDNFELRVGKLNLWGNNSFINTIWLSGSGGTPTLNINSDASLGDTANGVVLTASGTIQLPAATTVDLAASRAIGIASGRVATFDIPAGSSLTVNGSVTNGGSLVKTSPGTLALAGANSYSGGTTISGGTLSTTDDASLGALPTTPQTNLTFTASATLGAGANHTLAANRMIALGSNSAVNATFNPQAYTQTVCGVVSGRAGSYFYKDGPGMVVLAPDADKTNSVAYMTILAGTLRIDSGTTLVTNNAVSWNDCLMIGSSATGGNPGTNATLLVAGGYFGTSAGGSGWGACTRDGGALMVTNGIADFTSTREFINAYWATGYTNMSASVTVSGSGVLDVKILRPTHSYSPADQNVVNVNTGGTIRLNNFFVDTNPVNPARCGTVNLNGGTLVAKMSVDNFLGVSTDLRWLTNVFYYVREGGAIFDSDTYTIRASMPLYKGATVDGGLTKRGSGLLTLACTNTYTGVTRVEAGTLRLNLSGLLPSANSAFVASGAVFDVNGKEQTLAGLAGSGLVTNNSLLSVTDSVTPGGAAAIGTLTLATTPAALGGTFLADVDADGACDRLHVQGDLDLSTLDLQVANPADLNMKHGYTIASCTGNLTGTFRSAALPARWSVRYNAGEASLRYNFGTLILVH